jgi:hypothetical protein
VTQAGRTGAGLEALLAARRRLVLEQQTEAPVLLHPNLRGPRYFQ